MYQNHQNHPLTKEHQCSSSLNLNTSDSSVFDLGTMITSNPLDEEEEVFEEVPQESSNETRKPPLRRKKKPSTMDLIKQITERNDYGDLKIGIVDLVHLEASPHQVAGHGTRKTRKELSLLVKDGKIYKAINQGKKRSWSEVNFYERQISKAPYLLPFIPKYYGVHRAFLPPEESQHLMSNGNLLASSSSLESLYLHRTNVSTNGSSGASLALSSNGSSIAEISTAKTSDFIDFIVLEDITSSMEHPNVIDIKMGQRTYGEDASPEKILEEEAKYEYQRTLGLRLSGCKIYNHVTHEYEFFDRKWGRTITPEHLIDGLELFFFSKEGYIKEEKRQDVGIYVLSQILKEIKKIYHVFREKNSMYRFYASSLLIAYDYTKRFSIKIIDFAHVHENFLKEPIYDEGFIFGLATMISNCERLLEKYETK